MGDHQILEALEGADMVIIPARVPKKPGLARDDLIRISALPRHSTGAKHCPTVSTLPDDRHFKSAVKVHVFDCPTFGYLELLVLAFAVIFGSFLI